VGVRLLHQEDDGMRFPLVQMGKGTMSEEFEDYDLPGLTAWESAETSIMQ
jgi:hypothetical protein